MGVRLDTDQEESRRYVADVKQFNDLAHVYTTSPLFTLFPITWLLIGRGTETRRCVRELKQFTRKASKRRRTRIGHLDY